jgi:ribonuclease III family protein
MLIVAPAAEPSLALSEVQRLSPAALAYVGDAVYELFVRTHFLLPPQRLITYHNWVVAQVRAEAQAVYLQQLLPQLLPEEKEIVRRGRNAAGKGPQRLDPAIYQQATGFEALLGYLYLTQPHRLRELLKQLASTI